MTSSATPAADSALDPDGTHRTDFVTVTYGVLLDGRGSIEECPTREEAQAAVEDGRGFAVVRITQELLASTGESVAEAEREKATADLLMRLDRAHMMSCSDPNDPTRKTTYSECAQEIRRLQAELDALRTAARTASASQEHR